MRYEYPQISGGYRWNMLQRIKLELGIEPIVTGDIAGKTVVEFNRELTTAEKTKLDTLMSGSPASPPTPTGTRFIIKDIWEFLSQFNTATGINFKLYYSESVPGSGKIDQIELHAPSTLNNTQKNKVRTEYANLLREG